MINIDLARWASIAKAATRVRAAVRTFRTIRMPALPRPVQAIGRFLADHALFLVALAGGATVRVVTARGYPGVLWFTGDSNWYLGRTLRPVASASKSLGYPFFLQVLERFHSFEPVSALQHLMGLLVAVMIYVLMRRAGLAGWLATLLTAPVLFDAFQVQLEHLLMAEALFTFLIAAAVTMLLWRRRPLWWVALLAGLLLGYAVLVRTAGAALLPVLAGCLVLRWAGWRSLLAFTVGAALPVLTYMQWFHTEHGVHGLTQSDGLYLWGRTSSFADCAKVKPPAEERKLCMRVSPDRRLAPGTLIWRNEAPVRQLQGSVISPENNKMLRDYSIRVIKAQPGDYLHTIVDDLGKAVSGRRFRHPNPRTESLYHFTGKRRIFTSHVYISGGTALSDAIAYGGSDPGRVVQPYARQMVAYQERVFLPGPVLGAIFILGAAGMIFARGHRLEVMIAWGVASTLLVGPIATADFDYRYVLPAVPFACLAAGLALAPRPRPAGARSGPAAKVPEQAEAPGPTPSEAPTQTSAEEPPPEAPRPSSASASGAVHR